MSPILIALVLLAPGRDPACTGASAQATSVPTAILGEGALENDVFLPRSMAAERRLAEGDKAFASAAQSALAADAETPRALVQAFESWRTALVESAPGDAVGSGPPAHGAERGTFPPDPDATGARRTEAVEYAVLRRLAALDASLAAAWSRRFEELGARELASANGEVDRLVLVEHNNPATRAAVEASIVLADLDFECGESAFARQRLERARIHLALVHGGDPRLAAAIERRSIAIDAALARQHKAAGEERWRSATRLVPIASIPLGAPDPGPVPRSQRGVVPGLSWRDDGSLIVQALERLLVVDAAGGVTTIDLGALAGPLGWSWMAPFNDPDGEWPLLPASAGARVVVVAGRSQGSRGNALVCLEPGAAGVSARLAWGYSDRGFAGPDGARAEVASLLGPGLWGFEPGPLSTDGLVIVQARQWGTEAGDAALVDERESRAWCLAFELESGRLRWKRLLAVGADARRLRADVRPSARGVASPAAPLAADGGRVFAGTELGAAALLETCDGRPCWTFANRRHAGATEGSRASRAPIVIGLAGAGPAAASRTWLWAPADSDRIYRLRGAPLLSDPRILRAASEPRAEGELLEAADARSSYFSARAGDRTVLILEDADSGRRTVAFELEHEEGLGRGLLLCDRRAYHASSRALYLFDRERELFLLDARPLAPSAESAPDRALGGLVAARGERVVVVDLRAISIFRAE